MKSEEGRVTKPVGFDPFGPDGDAAGAWEQLDGAGHAQLAELGCWGRLRCGTHGG